MTPTALKALLDSASVPNSLGIAEPECVEYWGLSLTIGTATARFLVGKTTPAKSGHFATVWVRSETGLIRPFDTHDAVSRVLVYVASGDFRGIFVFPTAELVARGVVSVGLIGGKRAIRVYAPWVETSSAQAARTQQWQAAWFVSLGSTSGVTRLTQLLAG